MSLSVGRSGIALIAKLAPDIAVVDYQMPDLDGLGVLNAVVRDGATTQVLFLSALTEGSMAFAALQQGAVGFVSKEARRAEIADAVPRAGRGKTVISAELAAGLVDQIRLRARDDVPLLSKRERQVLRAFAQGRSIPQVAGELFLGTSTVKTHTQRMYEKLGVSDRAAAVAEGMRRGLLE